MKRRYQALGLVVGLLMAMYLVGCAGVPWQKQAVTSYEGLAIGMKTSFNIAKPLCDNGTLKAEDCIQIKDIYNQARLAYLTAGDTLALAIITEDAVKQQTIYKEFQTLSDRFVKLSGSMVDLLVKLNVLKGGK